MAKQQYTHAMHVHARNTTLTGKTAGASQKCASVGCTKCLN